MEQLKVKNSIIRKCPECGTDVVINYGSMDAIYYDKKTYHLNCFISVCKKRSNGKNVTRRKEKWANALADIEKIKEESKNHFKEALAKDDLFYFLLEFYGINIIPSYVWTKIAAINDGSYKGMSIGIPYSHLLDMWKRKQKFLLKLADKNKTKGKELEPAEQLNYDLSVLMNKYDSYLEFLEKEKIRETKEIKRPVVSISTTYKKQEYQKESDISSLIDEIFGG